MTHLFYFMGLLFLIYEIHFLFNIKEKIANGKKYKDYVKDNPDVTYSQYPDKIKNAFLETAIVGIPYILWMFVGILSSQWIVFATYLVFAFGVVTPLRKLVGYSPVRFYVTFTDTVVSIFVLGFIIINKYHLHIDTLSYIKNLFNI